MIEKTPSPTGLLHLGHARTFWLAAQRAATVQGTLLLRNDDLDTAHCRPEFIDAFESDLSWLGLNWHSPMVHQSRRLEIYRSALNKLHAIGAIYPCHRSRREVAAAASAPHEDGLNDEPLYPSSWRPEETIAILAPTAPVTCNWRFRVPDGEVVSFLDRAAGPQHATAGRDFGDFLVWRKDDVPSYQLACAVDDGEMGITEVVRGADLITSTFRQLLLLRALSLPTPIYYHAPLMTDEHEERLAKRHDALSLRESGVSVSEIIDRFRA
ncbi:MAG: tRNA glutamyl-Q synthetase [Candidatus Synoicihabitans palmerolidicus]|nr:tRNA glutamyl-Q synthetase [Candidatus Synoicihabitans palmerolidicus]